MYRYHTAYKQGALGQDIVKLESPRRKNVDKMKKNSQLKTHVDCLFVYLIHVCFF